MKNFFSGLARLFALIFAVLFVVSMVAALILFNVQSRALDANTYKSVLEAQGIYNRLPTLLAEQIHGQLKTTDCEGNPLPVSREVFQTNFPPACKKGWENLLRLN